MSALWLARLLRLIPAAALLTLSAALAGCATLRKPQVDVAGATQVAYVDRAVPVACFDPKALPSPPAPIGAQLSGEARHDAAILAAALLAERATRDRAMALLAGCAK